MGSNPSPAGQDIVSPISLGKRALKILKVVFGLAVVVFWVLLIQRNWRALATTNWSLDAPWAIAALLFFVLYFLTCAVGWTMVARSMGYRLPVVKGSGVWLISMPARYVPGNLWHIAARISLASKHDVPPEGVVVSSSAEQLLTLLSAACLGLAWLPSWAGAGRAPWAIALFLACLAGLQPPVLRLLLRIGSKLLGRTTPTINLGYRQMAALLVWYLLANAANGLAFALLGTASARVDQSLWVDFASAYCLAYVVGYLSFLTPSGLGVREAALASMLGVYLPIPTAVALALLARLLSTLGEAVAVLTVGLPVAGPRRR